MVNDPRLSEIQEVKTFGARPTVFLRGKTLSTLANRLVFQKEDGNLVLYQGGTALWSTGVFGDPEFFSMEPDGDLVIYDATGVRLWAAGTGGNPGAFLRLSGTSLQICLGEDVVIKTLWNGEP